MFQKNHCKRFITVIIANNEQCVEAIEFSGQEFISSPFQYVLKAYCRDKKYLQDINLGTGISVCLHHENLEKNQQQWIHGFLKSMVVCDCLTTGLPLITGCIAPKLSLSKQNQKNRSFFNKTVLEIILQVMEDLEISVIVDASVKITDKIAYCVQYQESDFNFIQRLLTQYGIDYYFQHNQNHKFGCQLVLICDPHRLPSYQNAVNFDSASLQPDAQKIYQWQTVNAMALLNTMKISTNPEKLKVFADDKLLKRQKWPIKINPKTQNYLHDESVLSTQSQSMKFLAQDYNRKQTMKWIKVIGNYANVFSGMKFDIEPNIKNFPKGMYYSTSMQLVARNANFIDTKHKVNKETFYQQTLFLKPLQSHFEVTKDYDVNVKEPGILFASTITDQGNESYLSSQRFAEVKLRMVWQPRHQQLYPWVRTIQNQAPSKSGTQYTSASGQTALLLFKQGHLHQPISIGGIYTDSQKPVFNSDHQLGIKTAQSKKWFTWCGTTSSYNVETKGSKVLTVNGDFSYKSREFNVVVKKGNYCHSVKKTMRICANKKVQFIVGSNKLIVTETAIQIVGKKINFHGF